MTFTKPEQEKHRKAFIDECRQKAWGAACHADWISKGVDDIMAHYQKLQAEDRALEEAIKAAEVAVDYHTVENRNKRKSMQERRNTLGGKMKFLSQNAQQGQQFLQQLYARHEEQPGARQTRRGMGRKWRPRAKLDTVHPDAAGGVASLWSVSSGLGASFLSSAASLLPWPLLAGKSYSG